MTVIASGDSLSRSVKGPARWAYSPNAICDSWLMNCASLVRLGKMVSVFNGAGRPFAECRTRTTAPHAARAAGRGDLLIITRSPRHLPERTSDFVQRAPGAPAV